MSVAWLTIRDGRDTYHEEALASAREMLPTPDEVVDVDDRDHRLGFAGAIAKGWRRVLETGCDWVVHLELDFTVHAPVPLDQMIGVLERRPYLAQMSLLRQPVNARELAAGGIIQADPDGFTEVTDQGDVWVEQRCYWTTNPATYRAATCAQGWPQVARSEGVFTHRLLHDPAVRFGIWGGKFDRPLVEHIGERAGVGY